MAFLEHDEESLFDVLPDEILEMILTHFPHSHFQRLALVCQRWNYLLSSPFVWQNIVLPRCTELTSGLVEKVVSLSPIRLSLSNIKVTNQPHVFNQRLKRLCSLTQLRSLNLCGCLNLNDDGVQHLSSLSSLQSLDLSWCQGASEDFLRHLVCLSRLTSLILNGGRWDSYSSPGLRQLTAFHSLKKLHITDINNLATSCVHNEVLKGLAQLTELRELKIQIAAQTDDMNTLTHLTNLRRLIIKSNGFGITGPRKPYECWAELSFLPSLLKLQVLSFHDVLLTTKGLAHLKRVTACHSLSLLQCDELTDDALSVFKHMTWLKSLTLFCCQKLSDQGIAHLSNLIRLTSLNLSGTEKATKEGLKRIRVLTEMKSLKLNEIPSIYDNSLKHVACLTQLTLLELKNTNISEVGLKSLTTLRDLRVLDVRYCAKIRHLDVWESISPSHVKTIAFN